MVVPDNLPEFCNLLLHEFGHSYINPLTEQNINEVYSCSNLFDPIKENMNRQAYGSWDFCVNEHVVRSVTYIILNEIFGAGVSQHYLKQDIANDFIFIDELSERLGEYESNRNKYPTIKDFYPRMLDVLKDKSRNK